MQIKDVWAHSLSEKTKENRSTPVSKHFTNKSHSVNDLRFSILEWCSLKYNTPEHIKKFERCWMWNIGAIHPVGIDQFIFNCISLLAFINTLNASVTYLCNFTILCVYFVICILNLIYVYL